MIGVKSMMGLKRKTRRAVALCAPTLLLFALVTPALASSSTEEGGSHLMELVWQAVNFAILLAVLVYFARKPIQAFFASRRETIQSELNEAAGLLEEAERRYSQWQRKLIDLEQELQQIRSDGRRRAEEEREQILADAQSQAERIHRDAVASVEQELRRAQAELRNESAVLATEIAERILREQLADSDRDRLIDEFVTRIEPAAGRE